MGIRGSAGRAVRLTGPVPEPNDSRSWWLREAMTADPGDTCAPLAETVLTDVAVVGGGYTGMWTAYFLKEADPSVNVILIEADICGGGPSGRNGGFLNGMWEDYAVLAALFGPEEAVRVGRATDDCVDKLEEVFRTAGIDVWFRRDGHLAVSTSPMFDSALEEFLKPFRAHSGLPENLFVPLSRVEVAARCRSPRFRAGVLHPSGATVQPARVARGLRRLILELGVRVHESTPVTSIVPGKVVRLTTPGGEVVADRVVLGLNAWSGQIPEFRRAILPRASHIVLTEPAPELLEEIGWTGGVGIYDFRATLHYVRTTNDGRIAFGAGTGDAARHIGSRFAHDPTWDRRLEGKLHAWFPQFRGVRIDAAWGGAVDVSGYHVPFFGSMWGGRAHYGMGFTGGGVGACVLGARILSALALGRRDEYSSLPLVGYRPKRFPPDPLLSVAARATLEAIMRTDDAYESGRKGNPVLRQIARAPRWFGYNLGH